MREVKNHLPNLFPVKMDNEDQEGITHYMNHAKCNSNVISLWKYKSTSSKVENMKKLKENANFHEIYLKGSTGQVKTLEMASFFSPKMQMS